MSSRRVIVGRARDRAAKRAWLANAGADATIRSDVGREEDSRHHTAKVSPDHPDYADKVAKPVMDAVDDLPEEYRLAVHEFGYVDVYRAWKRRIPVARIRQMAEANGGRFVL